MASINPVHSLIANVMAGVGEPYLLLKGGASPHAYSLKPSDAAALADAGIIVWIGPELERFLAKPIAANDQDKTIITILNHKEIQLLEARSGGVWEHHDDDGHDHANHARDDGDAAAGADMDAHVWLSPANAAAIVRAARDALVARDGARAAMYRANADATLARLRSLDESLRAQLEPVRGVPYIVFHDAYHYLEHHFGLHPAGSVTVSPERPPGAARLAVMRRVIAERKAACVFTEPQFEPAILRTISADSGIKSGILDPVGADLPPGPDAYFDMMHALADALAGCLGEQ